MRVVELDMEHCPTYGGDLQIIAVTMEPPVIERILKHLGAAGSGAGRRHLPEVRCRKRPDPASRKAR